MPISAWCTCRRREPHDDSCRSVTSVTHSAPATALTTLGSCCVVLGGLVAAVTEPLSLPHGSWAAAYLVLVGGVAQYAMGHDRRQPARRPAHRSGWLQLGMWNAGNALVIGGTLTGTPPLVDAGSILLVIGLVIAFRITTGTTATARDGRRNLSTLAYRIVLLVLTISIPIGIVLSHLRHP